MPLFAGPKGVRSNGVRNCRQGSSLRQADGAHGARRRSSTFSAPHHLFGALAIDTDRKGGSTSVRFRSDDAEARQVGEKDALDARQALFGGLTLSLGTLSLGSDLPLYGAAENYDGDVDVDPFERGQRPSHHDRNVHTQTLSSAALAAMARAGPGTSPPCHTYRPSMDALIRLRRRSADSVDRHVVPDPDAPGDGGRKGSSCALGTLGFGGGEGDAEKSEDESCESDA